MKKLLIFFIAAFLSLQHVMAQPFADEIRAFKRQDSVSLPPKNQILFAGSSSFRLWKDVQNYFPGYPILNRGFGGSTLPDVIRYVDDIMFPYHPKQIVIYCGENDLAASDTVTAAVVVERFKTLFYIIRKRMPKVPVVFVSLKPSPSRAHLLPKMEEANNGIREFLARQKKTAFIDVYHLMLDANGQPMKDLFREDNLHMKPNGYAIWQKAIQPYLLK